MHLEPKWGPSRADLHEIRPLAAIADEGWTFLVQFVEAFDRTPHEHVCGVRAHVLRMAVDATLRDIDEAAAFNGSRRSGNGCGGLYSVDDKSN